MNIETEKTCTKCGETKPVGDFYRKREGRDTQCKKCKEERKKPYNKAYYLANKEKARAHNKTYRLANAKKLQNYRLANAEKKDEYNKAYRLANKAKLSTYDKAYSLANPEKVKARHRVYRLANQEKVSDYRKAYRLANPEKVRAYDRKRRALEMGAYRETYQDIHIYERDGWKCGICGRKINKRLKHPHPYSKSIDHIVALSMGGVDAPINLQPAHLRCNLSKQAGSGGQLLLIG